MAHSTQAAHGHMHDYEGHVQAVEADLEYWRTKRLEPRVFQLHRRGVLTLYDLLRAAADVPAAPAPAGEAAHDTEDRIRALEDGLDEYIRGIGLASIDSPDHPFVIEDTRKERGDYDDFFRIAKPPHGGTLEERIARLEHDLREYQRLLQVLMRALLDKGVLTTEQIERQRAFLAGRGAWNGARIVARAWVDPAFKQAASRARPRGGARAEHSARPARQARRSREHGDAAQRRGLHALLMLPARPAGRSTVVVPRRQLQGAHRPRPARHAGGSV